MNFAESEYTSLIAEICQDASELYPSKIRCSFPDEKVIGNFDRTAVRRVIENLISNAVKYGRPDEDILLGLAQTNEEVILLVNNQGPPIPQEKQNLMFKFLHHGDDPKSTGNNKSWGMGLSLVKLIVDAHEGSIDLTSNEAHGTTFKISLKKHLKHQGKLRMKLSASISEGSDVPFHQWWRPHF